MKCEKQTVQGYWNVGIRMCVHMWKCWRSSSVNLFECKSCNLRRLLELCKLFCCLQISNRTQINGWSRQQLHFISQNFVLNFPWQIASTWGAHFFFFRRNVGKKIPQTKHLFQTENVINLNDTHTRGNVYREHKTPCNTRIVAIYVRF